VCPYCYQRCYPREVDGSGRGTKDEGPRERPALRQPRDQIDAELREQLAKGVALRDAAVSPWDDLNKELRSAGLDVDLNKV
jgi:hypothetical protein